MKTSIALLLVAATPGGCGSKDAADQPSDANPVALVRTATAEAGSAATQLTLYGAAEAAAGGERTLIAPAEAIVARIDAPTGTLVRAGQPVLTLRPSKATAIELAKASSDAAAADAAYARAQRLRGDGLVSDADVETAHAAAIAARAAAANLGISNDGVKVRAPIAGTVQGLATKPGDQIAQGAAIATILAAGDLRARFGIDPATARSLHAGQRLALDRIGGGAPVEAAISGVDPQVDAATRMASVYVRLPGNYGVGPGEPLRAALSLPGAGGVTIPYAALLDDGGKSFVFVVRGGAAHKLAVSPGSSSGDRIAILGGLRPGDVVVTEGGTGLDDGMKIRTGPVTAAGT